MLILDPQDGLERIQNHKTRNSLEKLAMNMCPVLLHPGDDA